MVSEFGFWEGGYWRWNFPISNGVVRNDNGAEEEESIKTILCEIHPGRGIEDACVWVVNDNKLFYVQSFYKIIMQGEELTEVNEATKEALSLMWETKVPSKVKIVTWRLFICKLATRKQLI